MATPAPGQQISFLDIKTEFGGTSINNYFGSYFAGSGYVPLNTLNGNGGYIPQLPPSLVPPQLSFNDFHGAAQVPNPLTINVLVVGGGGGGGQRWGPDYGNCNGGAGAGGMRIESLAVTKGQTFTFSIGAGGGNGNGGDTTVARNGSEIYRAYGGGRGGGCDDQSGSGGGSGGGGAMNGGAGGPGYQPSYGGYGNPGSPNTGAAGGGGGAGAAASGTSKGAGRTWPGDGGVYANGGNSSGGNGGIGYPGAYSGGALYGNGGGGSNNPNGGGPTPTVGYQGIVIFGYTWPIQLLSGGTVSSSGSGYSKIWLHKITSSPQSITY